MITFLQLALCFEDEFQERDELDLFPSSWNDSWLEPFQATFLDEHVLLPQNGLKKWQKDSSGKYWALHNAFVGINLQLDEEPEPSSIVYLNSQTSVSKMHHIPR